MIDVKIGDIILAKPNIMKRFGMKQDENRPKIFKGRVVYIHPNGAYITAAFDLNGNEIRESFKPGDFKKEKGI